MAGTRCGLAGTARVIVARHPAPPAGKKVSVGKRVGEWVYELFITTLGADGVLVEDVLDLSHGRGAFEAVLADEDVEEDERLDGAPTLSVAKNSGKLCVNGCGTCASRLERWCREVISVRWSGRLLQKLPRFSLLGKTRQKSMARGSVLESQAERLVVSPPMPSPMPREREAALPSRCRPLVERSASRERFYPTSRLPRLPDRLSTMFSARAVSRRKAAKGNRARRVSAVRRLLPPPASVERKPVMLGPMRWVDVAGRALRRTWTAHWRQHYGAILPLVQIQQEILPPPRPPRAVRSHRRWSWQDRLARNAGFGPPHLRVSVAGVPACLAMK